MEDNTKDILENDSEGWDETEEPDYYICNSCGETSTTKNCECPRCLILMEEGYF